MLFAGFFSCSFPPARATAAVEQTCAFDDAVIAIKNVEDLLLEPVAEGRAHVASERAWKGAHVLGAPNTLCFATVGNPRNVSYLKSPNIPKKYSLLSLMLGQGDSLSKIFADFLSMAQSVTSIGEGTELVPFSPCAEAFGTAMSSD
jgi:hypothetical protein